MPKTKQHTGLLSSITSLLAGTEGANTFEEVPSTLQGWDEAGQPISLNNSGYSGLPARDTRGFIGKVTGQPDYASQINAQYLGAKARLPLEQQAFGQQQRTLTDEGLRREQLLQDFKNTQLGQSLISLANAAGPGGYNKYVQGEGGSFGDIGRDYGTQFGSFTSGGAYGAQSAARASEASDQNKYLSLMGERPYVAQTAAANASTGANRATLGEELSSSPAYGEAFKRAGMFSLGEPEKAFGVKSRVNVGMNDTTYAPDLGQVFYGNSVRTESVPKTFTYVDPKTGKPVTMTLPGMDKDISYVPGSVSPYQQSQPVSQEELDAAGNRATTNEAKDKMNVPAAPYAEPEKPAPMITSGPPSGLSSIRSPEEAFGAKSSFTAGKTPNTEAIKAKSRSDRIIELKQRLNNANSGRGNFMGRDEYERLYRELDQLLR